MDSAHARAFIVGVRLLDEKPARLIRRLAQIRNAIVVLHLIPMIELIARQITKGHEPGENVRHSGNATDFDLPISFGADGTGPLPIEINAAILPVKISRLRIVPKKLSALLEESHVYATNGIAQIESVRAIHWRA